MPGFNIPTPPSCSTDALQQDSTYLGPVSSVETARRHRYLLEVLEPFGTQDSGLLLFLSTCGRPTPEIDQIVIHNGQDEIYRPGKQRWGPVEFTFYEKLTPQDPPFTDQAAQFIYDWWGNG